MTDGADKDRYTIQQQSVSASRNYMETTASLKSVNSKINNLEKTEKELIEDFKYQQKTKYTIRKSDILLWVVMFALGCTLTFGIIHFNIESIVVGAFSDQVIENAEEPKKEAEKQAKIIIADANKTAKINIEEAEKQAKEIIKNAEISTKDLVQKTEKE